MKKHARIVGEVFYSPGDGASSPIPRGPCEIEVTSQDATITWVDGDANGLTSLPFDTYTAYLTEGAIVLDDDARGG